MSATPDATPADGDPGDDTARRYRFQWTYAASVACMLLDSTQGVVEVFCEHHEDVLAKHDDGSFTGLQIKSRDSDQGLWKTDDDGVRQSLARFAKLEAQFPGKFRAFRFLTNHPMFAGANSKDLCHVLAEIRAAASLDGLPKPMQSLLREIASAAGCPEEIALAALKKTDARDDLPKLPDAPARLVHTMTTVWSRASECTYSVVRRAADELIAACEQASSLAHEETLPAYFSATSNPVAAELAARLDGKRIDQVKLISILERGLSTTATLAGDPASRIEPGAGTPALLTQKLDAGGFSAVSSNSAADLRDKADYLGVLWNNKYGRDKGLERYGHIRSLVLSDCARAFEGARADGQIFGLRMLARLRARFQERRGGSTQLFECSDEHLEGFAYSLTAECKVHWSNERPWEQS